MQTMKMQPRRKFSVTCTGCGEHYNPLYTPSYSHHVLHAAMADLQQERDDLFRDYFYCYGY